MKKKTQAGFGCVASRQRPMALYVSSFWAVGGEKGARCGSWSFCTTLIFCFEGVAWFLCVFGAVASGVEWRGGGGDGS